MKMESKRRIWLAISFIGLLGFMRSLDVQMADSSDDMIFSKEAGFYQEDIRITLEAPDMSEIYYTLDNTAPSKEAVLYQEPIELAVPGEEIEAYTIRAVGYDEAGEASEIYTHTYFLGKGVEDRFSTRVCAITSDPVNLYDDDKGILVGGRMKREYLEANPDTPEAAAPANYYFRGRDSEREAYVEIFTPNGEELLSQPAGVRVHGGVSRYLEQKSLRLIARKEYGAEFFDIQLFEAEEQSAYKKFVLRNSGNDNQNAFMRNECGLRLFQQAGFPDTTEFAPMAVFINGEYYGFEWLTEVYDDCYFHENYGTTENQGSWQVLDVGDELLQPEDPWDLAEMQAVEDWNEIYTLCTTKDLTDDSVFREFAAKVDVENFLLYHFMELYLANPDWPFNNNKVYRWYSNGNAYGEEGADGKWRFLTYDFDEAIAKTDSSAAWDLSLSKALGLEDAGHWKRYYPMLAAVLKREDMKKRFAEIAKEQIEGALSPENFCKVIDEIAAMREEEVFIYQQALAQGESEQADEQAKILQEHRERLLEEEEKMKAFAKERPAYMEEELKVLESF